MSTPLEILKEMVKVPNAPFSPIARIKFLKDFFSKNNLECEENDYALIVRQGSENATNKIVIMSHIDHPGFILKNSEEGIYFGSIYYEKLREFYKDTPLPINVFSKVGEFITKASLTNLTKTPTQKSQFNQTNQFQKTLRLCGMLKASKTQGKKSCVSAMIMTCLQL